MKAQDDLCEMKFKNVRLKVTFKSALKRVDLF